jgi:hypothetical protein
MDTSSYCPQPRWIRINAQRSSGGHHYPDIIGKGGNMRTQGTGNSVRQRITRVLTAGVLLFMYAFGMVATTGAFVAAGVSPAFAQRGRGRGRGGGWGRGRGDGVGAAIGIGVGAAIIGGAIAASAAEQQRRDAVSYCMQRYRSYDPNSQTYLGRDGLRRSCP